MKETLLLLESGNTDIMTCLNDILALNLPDPPNSDIINAFQIVLDEIIKLKPLTYHDKSQEIIRHSCTFRNISSWLFLLVQNRIFGKRVHFVKYNLI